MLSFYQQDTAQLLRDSNYQFTSQNQLTRYINQARRQIAFQTGCIRCLISGQSPFGNAFVPGSAIPGGAQPGSQQGSSFSTIAGVEKYAYGYANAYLQASNAGVKEIIDVIDVAVSWGSLRPTLNWMPWEDLQAYARSYNIGVFSYPFVWSTGGDGTKGQVWLFPVPQITSSNQFSGQQGEMEWDVSCLPLDLATDADYEALPGGFHECVKFYAAHLAFLGSQRYAMANVMLALFNENLGIGRAASDRGKTVDWYWTGGV